MRHGLQAPYGIHTAPLLGAGIFLWYMNSCPYEGTENPLMMSQVV